MIMIARTVVQHKTRKEEMKTQNERLDKYMDDIGLGLSNGMFLGSYYKDRYAEMKVTLLDGNALFPKEEKKK